MVQSMLEAAWTKANTGGKTPRIVVADDEKDVNSSKFYDVSSTDFLILYITSIPPQKPMGLGTGYKEVRQLFTIDVRSGISRDHHYDIIGEVDRILDVKFLNPVTGFTHLLPGGWLDHSDKLARLWRHSIDVELLNYAVARGS